MKVYLIMGQVNLLSLQPVNNTWCRVGNVIDAVVLVLNIMMFISLSGKHKVRVRDLVAKIDEKSKIQ